MFVVGQSFHDVSLARNDFLPLWTMVVAQTTARISSHMFYRWNKAQNETVLLYVATKHQYML